LRFKESLKLLKSTATVRNLILFFKIHLSECGSEALWLEDRIPSKHIFTTGSDDLTFTSANKDLRFRIFVLTVSHNALSIGSLVLKAGQDVVESFSA
jgi:hypothetical protein